MSNEKIIEGLTRDVLLLKREIERLSNLKPLYQIINQAPHYQDITATQNNFSLGNYDMVTLNPTANRTVNGITGGNMGRFLIVRNASGSFTLSFPHENASATAANRIVTSTAATVVLGVRQTAFFEYMVDSTLGGGSQRWWLLIPYA